MMNKKSLMILFLISLILISGCTSQQSTTSLKGAYADCYGDDTKMISAEFDEYAPESSEVGPYQPDDEIPITVVLTSYFSDDIEASKAKVRLSGDAYTEDIFSGGKEEVKSEMLYGIDPETCTTEDTEVDMNPLTYKTPITTKTSKEITGLYCYEQPVIVKAFLYYTDDENLIGENLPAGSNPPSSLQITSIDQTPVDVDRSTGEGDMRFKIYLENVGEGTIVPSLDECFAYRESGYREELSLSVESAAYNVECPSSIRLSREEKTEIVTCKVTGIDIDNLGASASEITLVFDDFAYEEEIPSRTIYIEP
ncbi:MAG: hypothetical protein Q8Q35_04050 [Nanoarchaeota archaeon]|nr:hypothetical protein [Nanoarchaeota archaeon]